MYSYLQFVPRFAICAQNANEDDINYAWNLIAEVATDVLHACDSNREDNEAVKEIERIESLDLAEEEEAEEVGGIWVVITVEIQLMKNFTIAVIRQLSRLMTCGSKV